MKETNNIKIHHFPMRNITSNGVLGVQVDPPGLPAQKMCNPYASLYPFIVPIFVLVQWLYQWLYRWYGTISKCATLTMCDDASMMGLGGGCGKCGCKRRRNAALA